MDVTRRAVLGGMVASLALPLVPVLLAKDTFGLSLRLTSVVLDLSVSNLFDITLDSDVTFLHPVNASLGSVMTVVLRQDSVGGRKYDWVGEVMWERGLHPVVTTRPNGVDMHTLFWDGEAWYALAPVLDIV